MNLRPLFVLGLLFGLGWGCGSPLDTGTARKPTKNKPGPDGTCPLEQTACGTGAFAWCVDLQTDPAHCGTCDTACSPGIACQGGVCQQTACVGSSSPFSGTPDTGQPDYTRSHEQAFADVNGDGRLDLVEWQIDPQHDMDTFSVSLGQSSGGFSARETYQASFQVVNIRVTNDNDDGADDLFVFASTTLDQSTARVEVWLGHPDGHLTRARANDLGGANVSNGSAVALGDVSGDGWADLVTASSDDQHMLEVFLSDSTGALHATQTFRTRGFAVYSIFMRDWDMDGRPDLVVLNGDGLTILYNSGNGSFDQPLRCAVSFPAVAAEGVIAADFNRDGLIDFAFNGNPIRVLLRQSECGFAPVSSYLVPLPSSIPKTMGDREAGAGVPLMRASDMNGDGQLDLVVTFDVVYQVPFVLGEPATSLEDPVEGDTFLAILLGNADGTFQTQDTVIPLTSGWVTDLAIGESTGDQRPDVVASTADGDLRVWENTCQ